MTARAGEDSQHWVGSILALAGFISLLSLPHWANQLVMLVVEHMR